MFALVFSQFDRCARVAALYLMQIMSKQLHFRSAPVTSLGGSFTVPGDKSISHRALMLGALAKGSTRLTGFLYGEDNLATLSALRALGVSIQQHGAEVTITGVGRQGLDAVTHPLDLGNSGTGMRLLAGLLVGQSFDSELTGDESLRARPMQRIITPLQKMGARIVSAKNGRPPLQIFANSALQGIDYSSPLASAQVKSCVLLAGMYASGKTTVSEPVKSRDHTERLLRAFGYPLFLQGLSVAIESGHELTAIDLVIPADISSAAFFMVAACISPNADIVLENVGINPTRDGVIKILKLMGADITLSNQREVGFEPVADICVKSSSLSAIDIPSALIPSAIDEFPAIFIAAACASGTTRLRDAAELRVKETDRIEAMAAGLQALGVSAIPVADGIDVVGGQIQAGEVGSQGDHRIAMAFAVAATVASGPVKILNCANVATSFPTFVELANAIGMQITTEEAS